MDKATLLEANELQKQIDKYQNRLETLSRMTTKLKNGGELRLKLEVSDGIVESHQYNPENGELDYLLGFIRTKYEEKLFELKEEMEKL